MNLLEIELYNKFKIICFGHLRSVLKVSSSHLKHFFQKFKIQFKIQNFLIKNYDP